MNIDFPSPFPDFESAVQAVLSYLHERLGFQLWMFTRVDGNSWIVLQAEDHGYNVHSGDLFNWSDSFCSRMVLGLGPRVAPRVERVPVYLEAPIGRIVHIGAYIGLPIPDPDGKLFGTLCAIDPFPQSDLIEQELNFVQLQSRLLTTLLHFELQSQEATREMERAQVEAQIDLLTGIYNRNGWEKLSAAEEARCKAYGNSAAVVIVDLDDLKLVNDSSGHAAGDLLIQSAANSLVESVRKQDIVARIGGDEFAILMVEVSPEQTENLVQRIENNLVKFKIKASVGYANYSHKYPLKATTEKADLAMYRKKSLRKSLKAI
ncbi:MAG: hypothetical protein N5P05_003161 [Chroococcopsis gigantea SAG 12.99]|jgi:diguanylate cyclase|nr:sensor domain-containing diguanylate cyclase [Chlorogloea purpurea SAG 13.99]MDV3001555.1 hypothetical protein [Chroococcopsis gigantea SAG 12.99]